MDWFKVLVEVAEFAWGHRAEIDAAARRLFGTDRLSIKCSRCGRLIVDKDGKPQYDASGAVVAEPHECKRST